MKKIVGVLGGSGYIGAELMRILSQHSGFELAFATANSDSGKSIAECQPHLAALYPGLNFISFSSSGSLLKECDLVFIALPHGESMSVVSELKQVPYIIDLGSDFRLKDPQAYAKWYGFEHTQSQELKSWEYGLPELFRERLKGTKRIANPGCYATAVALSMGPLVRTGSVQGVIVADCLSGTSGAGKALKNDLHFSHADENVYAYKVGSHQHTPEIEQTLSEAAGKKIAISFTPHVIPMVRGIHATVSAEVSSGVTQAEIDSVFAESYKDEPFISLCSTPPSTKNVRGSNLAQIYPRLDARVGRVIVTTVIDNLVKGAAGQAIQNANIALGFEETFGIPRVGFYP